MESNIHRMASQVIRRWVFVSQVGFVLFHFFSLFYFCLLNFFQYVVLQPKEQNGVCYTRGDKLF